GDATDDPASGAVCSGAPSEQLFVGCATTLIVACALLFALFGSATGLVAVAVFVTVVLAAACTEYVEMIVTMNPDLSVPMLHGYGVVHAPLFEMNVRPAGVGSVTTTFGASLGPLLRICTPKLIVLPVAAC